MTEEVNTSEAKECWFQIKYLKMWNIGVKILSYQYALVARNTSAYVVIFINWQVTEFRMATDLE
jgi:hypothetical protein